MQLCQREKISSLILITNVATVLETLYIHLSLLAFLFFFDEQNVKTPHTCTLVDFPFFSFLSTFLNL